MSKGVWRVDSSRPVSLSVIIKLKPGLKVVELYNRGGAQGNQRSTRRPTLDKKKNSIVVYVLYVDEGVHHEPVNN